MSENVTLSNHLDRFPTFGVKSSFVPHSIDSAWNREFPESLCDVSLFVPLAKQVASLLSDSASTGVLAGASKVLKEDYTFPDGKIPHGVSLDLFTQLDNFKDIAEVSEYTDVLKAQISKIVKELNDSKAINGLDKIVVKLDSGRSLTSSDVALLAQFGISTDNSTDVKETLNK